MCIFLWVICTVVRIQGQITTKGGPRVKISCGPLLKEKIIIIITVQVNVRICCIPLFYNIAKLIFFCILGCWINQ